MAEDVHGQATEVPESSEVSEAQIAVHWREEEIYPPPASFVKQANANDPAILERFAEDKFPECFKEYADMLAWDQPWHTTLDTSNAPFFKWFVGGRLNASYNCVDRHAAANPDKTAIIFVGELESDEPVHVSYAELHRQVNEFAALLRDFAGLKTGDRVTLHLPMVAELPVTMLACARLGVIHSEVFGGFSGHACGTRIADSGSRVLITMDGYYRAGQLTDHKVKADEALAEAAKEGQEVDKVLVWRRHPGQYASQDPDGRGPGLLRRRTARRARREDRRAGVHARRGAAVPDVHQRHHRPPEGLPAQHRRLPRVRDRHVEVLPGHPPGRRVLVHGRHRLDHRPLLHRLRPAGARHHDPDLRGRPQLSGRRPAVADRGEARGEDLPHLAHRDPDAAQGRPGGAAEVQLPLQEHDHGRRADRARGLAVVLHRGRQGRGGDHRHLVADRERRLPGQHPARTAADEAGQLRAGRARHLPGDLRRERRRGADGQRQGGQHLHPQPLARHVPDDLGRSGAVPRPPTGRSTTRTRTARTGTTGRTSPTTGRSRPPTGTSGSWAGSTT